MESRVSGGATFHLERPDYNDSEEFRGFRTKSAANQQEGFMRVRKDFKSRRARRDKSSQLWRRRTSAVAPGNYTARRASSRMSDHNSKSSLNDGPLNWTSPSEPQSHIEHLDALDATLFRRANDPYELVLELEAGQLRLRVPLEK